MTKTELRKKTNKLIKQAVKGMRKNIDKAILSGAMNIVEAGDDYVLPTSLLLALLEREKWQMDMKGTRHYKQIKKEANNIYICI